MRIKWDNMQILCWLYVELKGINENILFILLFKIFIYVNVLFVEV